MTENNENVTISPRSPKLERITSIFFLGWIGFIIIWLFFYASDYTIYQNFAMFLASFLVVTGIVGLIWLIGGRLHIQIGMREISSYHGMRWRIILSSIIAAAWLIFLTVWLWAYASKYSLYQNIGVFFISLAPLAVLGLVWTTMKDINELGSTDTKPIDMSWQVNFSIIIGIAWLVVYGFWLWQFADSYTIYQNAAVFIVTLLISGAIIGASFRGKT